MFSDKTILKILGILLTATAICLLTGLALIAVALGATAHFLGSL